MLASVILTRSLRKTAGEALRLGANPFGEPTKAELERGAVGNLVLPAAKGRDPGAASFSDRWNIKPSLSAAKPAVDPRAAETGRMQDFARKLLAQTLKSKYAPEAKDLFSGKATDVAVDDDELKPSDKKITPNLPSDGTFGDFGRGGAVSRTEGARATAKKDGGPLGDDERGGAVSRTEGARATAKGDRESFGDEGQGGAVSPLDSARATAKKDGTFGDFDNNRGGAVSRTEGARATAKRDAGPLGDAGHGGAVAQQNMLERYWDRLKGGDAGTVAATGGAALLAALLTHNLLKKRSKR
jgi:hypothetical protein